MPRKIEVSHRTIIFTILFLGLAWFAVQVIPIIITLFIAVLLSTALKPVVDTLRHYKIPTAISILLAYIVLISLVVLSLSSVISPLIGQTTELVEHLPDIFNQLGVWLAGLGIPGINGNLLSAQASQLGALPGNLVHFVIFLFSNLIGVVTVLVITFYTLLERRNLDHYILLAFGQDREKQAKETMEAYKEAKINPFSGLLSTFIQFPILIALYYVFLRGFQPGELTEKLYSFIPNPGLINASFLGMIDLSKPNIILANLLRA